MDQSDLDKMFEGLVPDVDNAAATVRCIVELAYFETRATGSKKLSHVARFRVQQCVSPLLKDLPAPWDKLTNTELSRFGNKIQNARQTDFKYWRPHGVTRADLPFSIFCKETRRRIFRYFAEPLQAHIKAVQWVVDAKVTKSYYAVLKDLARLCDSTDCLEESIGLEALKASITAAKGKADELKEQLNRLGPEEDDSHLVTKLKRVLAESADLSRQLQEKLRQPPNDT